MLRTSLLLAFFISTSLSVNGQTESLLPPGGDRMRVEPSICEAAKGDSAPAENGCTRAESISAPGEEPERAQVPNDIECLFVEECVRSSPPPAPAGIDGAAIFPRLGLSHADLAGPGNKSAKVNDGERPGFKWGSAFKQYLLMLAVEHAYDLTQDKTRRELKGPFFKDYFRSVKGLGGWADGGRFVTNYVAHAMEGAAYGFIYVQNDPRGLREEFGKSKPYWISRLKAMAWSAACSAQFEIGPLSQASIGNVGLHTPHDGKGKRKMAYVDLVITPTVGTAWMVGEDMAERYILRRLENSNNPVLRKALRVLLTPTRSAANMLRFKVPWYRDN